MAKGTANQTATQPKPKAQPVKLGALMPAGCYAKTFASGKPGWFGKVTDTATGKRYQIIGAVELG